MAYIPLIDYTYFDTYLNISGISGTTVPALARRSELNAYIKRYEKKALISILGEDLYNAFQAGLVGTVAARWVALKAQLVDTTAKTSPLANYVWYKWQQTHQQTTTAQGDRQTNTENMGAHQNDALYVHVWNELVEFLPDFYEWLDTNVATYPEYNGEQWDIDEINTFGI